MGLHRAEARAAGGRRKKRQKKCEQERAGRRKKLLKKCEQERAGELLPGILNEVSVDIIAAKFLTWKDLCVLSCVSRGWCQAVRSREVYRARLRLQSTETLSLGCRVSLDYSQTINEVFLHSTRNDYGYRLPHIPGFPWMPPIACLQASLDGRIYVLGGEKIGTYRNDGFCVFSNEVFMLDLAGQNQWRRCASMKQGRGGFGGAVLDGKIYVFGGFQFIDAETRDKIRKEPFCASEVYDPQKNTWTSIKAIPSRRYSYHVIQAGPVLVMHGGFSSSLQKSGRSGKYEITRAGSLEIYHPGKDSWKVVSAKEGFPPGRTGKTTTLGDPRDLPDCRGIDGSHAGPRPSLSL